VFSGSTTDCDTDFNMDYSTGDALCECGSEQKGRFIDSTKVFMGLMSSCNGDDDTLASEESGGNVPSCAMGMSVYSTVTTPEEICNDPSAIAKIAKDQGWDAPPPDYWFMTRCCETCAPYQGTGGV